VQRASGIPCALFVFGGGKLLANLGRNAPRECEVIFAVIASEAKQSIAPHGKNGLLRRFAPRNDEESLQGIGVIAVRLLNCHFRHPDRRTEFCN
jgi:hypothetical protein